MWLAMRWPEAYPGYAQADSERGRLNGLIEAALTRKALARTCRECGGRMPADHPFGICDRCHRSRCGRWHDHDGDYDDDPEDYDDDLD